MTFGSFMLPEVQRGRLALPPLFTQEHQGRLQTEDYAADFVQWEDLEGSISPPSGELL